MNNRLTIQELAGLLADHTGKDKNVTERFLREFIAIVSEGVFADKIVKIKGLGTFKIIAVEQRESIHVNTGERFLIPAHYKFSFLPDKELKELVNKPFSFFETTEIGEDVDFSDMDVSEETEEKEAEDESVEEVMPEEQLLPPVVTEVPVETEEAPTVEETAAIIEEEAPLEEEATIETATEDVEITEEPVVEEPSVQEENIAEILEAGVVKDVSVPDDTIPEAVIPEETVVQPEEPVQSTKRKQKNRIFIIAVIVVLFAGINIGLYLNREFFKKEEVVLPVVEEENRDEPLLSDSDTVIPASGMPDKEEKVSEANVSKEEIGLVKIASGDRLTLISLKYYGHKIY